jgi:acyl-CoA reductase-like NAD-dependent aldehyde dehydrogenase
MMDIVDDLRDLNSMHTPKEVSDIGEKAADEIERLREDKAELLKALTNLYESCRWEKVCPTIDAAKDAIAKAIGGE